MTDWQSKLTSEEAEVAREYAETMVPDDDFTPPEALVKLRKIFADQKAQNLLGQRELVRRGYVRKIVI